MSPESKTDDICSIELNDCIYSRRCFMTGEYCSKQRSIQRERHQLREGDYCSSNNGGSETTGQREVNAFVVMNFSSMSDIIYKWRIKPFVEDLKNYLYIDNHKLYCSTRQNPREGKGKMVNRVNVIRADTNPSSNFVICNRICQQMQIADIVVVDVSDENANVFYEIGLAVAFGKLILPICYSESYFKEVLPAKLVKEMEEHDSDLRHHIDCFPWRRKLFEHFGMIYRDNDDVRKKEKSDTIETEYKAFEEVSNRIHGFSDQRWAAFPYYEYENEGGPTTVGQKIYGALKDSYNKSGHDKNTLIVYSMDRFLNPDEAGICIFNFYKKIVEKFAKERCFCGDRVGVLIQPNVIAEDTKDAKYRRKVPYKIGDIILTGMNQATYQTNMESIKCNKDEYLQPFIGQTVISGKGQTPAEDEPGQSTEIKLFYESLSRFTKEYIGNRGLPIYPETPVHVRQLKHGIQGKILDLEPFSFFDVMLKTLKYCNEIVVDISNNIVQMLFWLGAAHGAGIPAITAKYQPSDEELKEQMEEAVKVSSEPLQKDRNIFDVSGLWTAVLFSNRTDLFYRQLVDVQRGIEFGAKRLVPKIEDYESDMIKSLLTSNKNDAEVPIAKKAEREKRLLESYYRTHLWRRMLLTNSFVIYTPVKQNERDDNQEEFVSLWDVNSLARISNYLSKRKTIGNYEITAIKQSTSAESKAETITDDRNYLCLGKSGPHSGQSLEKYIASLTGNGSNNQIFSYDETAKKTSEQFGNLEEEYSSYCKYRTFRGFVKNNAHYFSQVPVPKCFSCSRICGNHAEIRWEKAKEEPASIIARLEREECKLPYDSSRGTDPRQNQHKELGQIVLWRDNTKKQQHLSDDLPADNLTDKDHMRFRVAVSGASGPATYAVASVLIDLEQKEDIFGRNDEKALYPLTEIQKIARNDFMNHYGSALVSNLYGPLNNLIKEYNNALGEKEKDKKISDKSRNKYISRVKEATSIYLNSTLFRFIFPFLSYEDMDTIANGLHSFINGMQSMELSPFSLNYKASEQYYEREDRTENTMTHEVIQKAEEIAVKTLREMLESIVCVEAMFEVTVGAVDEPKAGYPPKLYEEKRKVEKMKLFKRGRYLGVNCIYKKTNGRTP